MGSGIFQNVRQPYKKAFKRHADKLYKTAQSKPVKIGSETYVFVGQMRLKAFPLMSHFDVFDQARQSANEDVGKDVYAFVSLLMLARYVRDIQMVLKQQSAQVITEVELHQMFEGVSENDTMLLTSTPEQLVKCLDDFLHACDEVIAKEQWDAFDVKHVKKSWMSFGQHYSERAGALLRLAANNRAPQGEGSADQQAAQLIWKEASLFSKLSKSFTPMNASTGRFSLDELVSYHYRFGRVRRQDERPESVSKMERGLYRFVEILMRVFVVMTLIIVVALVADGEFEFPAVLPLLLFFFVGSFLKSQNKRRLLAKNHTYLMELRAVSMEEAADREEPVNDERSPVMQKKRESLYEAIVVSMDLVKVFAILTVVFIGVTAALMVEGDVDYTVLQYVFYVDVALFLFTVYVPFSRMAKRKVVVREQAIHIRKEKVSALEVIRIVVKNHGTDVDIFVNYNSNPFKLRVKKDDQGPMKEVLKSWCARNRIVFQDKDLPKAF